MASSMLMTTVVIATNRRMETAITLHEATEALKRSLWPTGDTDGERKSN
ncbi:hypothetical protein P3T43_000667 [Paraburkholderia sp. GAS41]|jgi:hypothetical protein